MSLDFLDQAAAQTTCDILSAAGYGLVGTAVPSLVAGGAGVVPLSLGALSLLASNALCPDTNVGGQLPPEGLDGCVGIAGGVGRLLSGAKGNMTPVTAPHSCQNQITGLNGREIGVGAQSGQWYARAQYTCLDGSSATSQLFYATPNTEEAAKAIYFGLEPLDGATCDRPADEPIQPMPPEVYTPRVYTDPTTNCSYTVTFQSFVETTSGGPVTPVFKIESSGPSGLNAGGVIGGCNFSPTLYFPGPVGPGGGGPGPGGPGGPTTIPWNPDWDAPVPPGTIPPWVIPLIQALAGAGGFADYTVPGGTREIYAACNYKQDGSPETYSVTFPSEKWSSRVLTAVDAITDFQQQILLWKTPTCSGGGQSVTGEPVTINWISDEFSGTSGDRVQKLLTYFDQSGKTQAEHQAHWKDFSWQAGPVIVSCVGTPLGKPQVWAVSLDEAKRVIGHAAAIAGVDLTDAEWMTGSPRSSSFGLRGTMRVKVSAQGLLWVTKRDGPFGLPTATI